MPTFIAEFSFRFCWFVFDVNQLKVKFADYYVISKTDFEYINCIINSEDYFSKSIIMCIFLCNVFGFERHCSSMQSYKITWVGRS